MWQWDWRASRLHPVSAGRHGKAKRPAPAFRCCPAQTFQIAVVHQEGAYRVQTQRVDRLIDPLHARGPYILNPVASQQCHVALFEPSHARSVHPRHFLIAERALRNTNPNTRVGYTSHRSSVKLASGHLILPTAIGGVAQTVVRYHTFSPGRYWAFGRRCSMSICAHSPARMPASNQPECLVAFQSCW